MIRVHTERGLPVSRGLVTLGLVNTIGNGNELRVRQVIGEGPALGGGPSVGTRLPGLR